MRAGLIVRRCRFCLLPTESRRDSVGVSGQSLSFVNPVCLVLQVIGHVPSKDWASQTFSRPSFAQSLTCSIKQGDLVDHFLAPPCSSRGYLERQSCFLHLAQTLSFFAVFHLTVSFIHNVLILPLQVHRKRHTIESG